MDFLLNLCSTLVVIPRMENSYNHAIHNALREVDTIERIVAIPGQVCLTECLREFQFATRNYRELLLNLIDKHPSMLPYLITAASNIVSYFGYIGEPIEIVLQITCPM